MATAVGDSAETLEITVSGMRSAGRRLAVHCAGWARRRGKAWRRAVVALALTGAAAAQQGAAPRSLAITGVTPSGTNVPAGRQIVIQFNRAVVPLGRMDRSADEIPIEITPALACRWHWLDTNALACELGERDRLRLATRYVVVVRPGIRARDGATMAGAERQEFTTELPRVSYAGFATWRSPGMPVIRAVFNQPVSESSVRAHLYVMREPDSARLAIDVEPDAETRDLPRYVRLPGELRFVDLGERTSEHVDDRPAPVGGETARRVWLVHPSAELPLDTRARLNVEPGLEGVEGEERGSESRTVAELTTFPEFAFLGVTCTTNAAAQVVLNAANVGRSGRCDPLGAVGLQFSAPVLDSEIAAHVDFAPDLAGARTDYNPWANRPGYSRLGGPHARGAIYTVWLPERLKAAESYRIATLATRNGPKDEFGRALTVPIELTFATDHRPPAYTLLHDTAVLEQASDSDVPLYVTNLGRFAVRYRALTEAGVATGLERSTALPRVLDAQYGVRLGVRELLGGRSGAIYGHLSTEPATAPRSWRAPLFAEVTPYELHVKLGHFNTLVWAAALATGAPVRNAAVSLYVGSLAELGAAAMPLATATTDSNGVAELPGTRELDPKLELSRYNCGRGDSGDSCPRLMVRVDGKDGLALLPLDYRFEVSSYRVSSYTVGARSEPEFGHVHAWGATAQGVYRAGDTLDYKLYVRDQSNESFAAAPAGPYTVEIIDPKGQVVQTERDVALTKFGGHAGRYAIPQSASVGWYQFRLTAQFGGANGEPPLVRYPLRVLVSDFTPAPFGVRTTLAGDLFQAGEDVRVQARATLYSGGPYTDAEARVTAQLRGKPFRSTNPVAAGFMFDAADGSAAMVVSQSTARLGATGELDQTFRLDPTLGAQLVYGTLTVEGAVRDDRGKYVASAASADFVAVDRLVGLKSTRWIFREDEPAEVDYLVVDPRGAPAAGTDVHVAIERLETKAARVKGAGNAYLTQFVDAWVAAGECAGRSTASAAHCTFTPNEPGSYRVTATIADTQGRPHRTELRAWVVGKGQVVWHGANDDALEIVPEKPAYGVGETARYLLKNPYPGARALVTIERYGVLKQWLQKLDGSTPVIEFPVGADYLPGFYLSVLVMSPRVAAPPPALGELDLGKPAFKLGYVAVPVDDPYKRLDVDVKTEREVYKPGETVHVRLKASARGRAREPIEVAVAVLDESVLDLVQGGTRYFDPYAGFYTLDGLDVRNYSLLTRLVGRQKIELKGANPGGDGGAALSMRSAFKYVSYWNPELVLDARGTGSFEFKLPDNLTGWRVLVMAATPSDRFGLGETELKVNLPTEVRPALPNQVTEGDRFDAAFTVMNRTAKPRDLKVGIAARGGVAAPAARELEVHLEPYARTTVAMPVEAARVALDRNLPAGRIDFDVTAGDATDADGLRVALAVEKRRSLVTAASYGAFDGDSATEHLEFPSDIRSDAGDVSLVLAPSVIGNIDGAFRYVRDYPYLCWEQRLTKGVMAADYLHLRDYLPADLEWSGAAALPEQTLGDAAEFQAPSGGMAYWVPNDEYVSPYLSAYTALAFGWLRDDGYEIPEAVERKLDDYLDAFLKRDTAPDFYTRGMASTVRAVALAALAKRGRLALADLERYRPHVDEMSLFGKAHYLQAALAVDGGEPIAREAEQKILAGSVRSAGKLQFNEALDDGYLRLSATPLDSSCAVLSAIAAGALAGGEIGPDGGVPFALVRAITQARGNRDHWENTQENVFCTRALLDYARRFEPAQPALEVTASLGAAPLGSARFGSVHDAAVTLARPIGPSDVGTASTLTLERRGTGRAYYAARMSYAPVEAAAEEVDAGVEVHREYSVQRGGRWVLLGNPVTLNQGELVRVDVYLSLPTAREFLVVDDPVPGGLEPVNRDLANASAVDADAGGFEAAGGSIWFRFSDWLGYGVSRWSFYHRELKHDAVRFYSDYLPPGRYHLSYSAQAVAAGEFAALPTRAVEMYDPDVYGLALPATVHVETAR